MKRTSVSTSKAPQAVGAYSQAIRCGDMVYCSGQIALDPSTGELLGGDDVRQQARRCIDNLAAVLEAAQTGLEHAVKTTIFLTDISSFAEVNEVYAGYFEGMTPPARSTIAVAGLPKGARVEVEAIAMIPKGV